jgi:hypothetical protein
LPNQFQARNLLHQRRQVLPQALRPPAYHGFQVFALRLIPVPRAHARAPSFRPIPARHKGRARPKAARRRRNSPRTTIFPTTAPNWAWARSLLR